MRFEGKCRLIFGLPRDPVGVSDMLDGVSVHGTLLSANGIPVRGVRSCTGDVARRARSYVVARLSLHPGSVVAAIRDRSEDSARSISSRCVSVRSECASARTMPSQVWRARSRFDRTFSADMLVVASRLRASRCILVSGCLQVRLPRVHEAFPLRGPLLD